MPNNPNAAANLKPFQKGDKRINRKGRPKSFDALRDLAQQIAHEITTVQTVDANGKVTGIDQRTRVETIMRQWAQSKDARLQQAFIEYAYGKPPQQTQLTGANGGPVEVETRVTNAGYDKAISTLADAIGESLSGKSTEQKGSMGSTK